MTSENTMSLVVESVRHSWGHDKVITWKQSKVGQNKSA